MTLSVTQTNGGNGDCSGNSLYYRLSIRCVRLVWLVQKTVAAFILITYIVLASRVTVKDVINKSWSYDWNGNCSQKFKSASLTKAISDAIVFICFRAASSQQYARVSPAMAQFVVKIAKFVSSPSKGYFVTVSVPYYGFCFLSTLQVTSLSIIQFLFFSFWLDLPLEQSRTFEKV